MDRFKFRIAVYERQQNNMPWEFVEYIDPNNQHWGLNQCGDIISDTSFSAHYTRKNAPDSVHRVYEPVMSTGLKDKNGNLIYEGDVVQYWWNQKTNTGTIFWNNEFARFCIANNETHCPEDSNCLMFVSDKKIIEIIGNIHEQAEQKEQQ